MKIVALLAGKWYCPFCFPAAVLRGKNIQNILHPGNIEWMIGGKVSVLVWVKVHFVCYQIRFKLSPNENIGWYWDKVDKLRQTHSSFILGCCWYLRSHGMVWSNCCLTQCVSYTRPCPSHCAVLVFFIVTDCTTV